MPLGEHYLRLMNLANQAHDRETYHYFVNQAQKLLSEEVPIPNQSLQILPNKATEYHQEAAWDSSQSI